MHRTILSCILAAGLILPAGVSHAQTGTNAWRLRSANVGAIVAALHDVQIEQAHFALQHATSQPVRDFAQMMISHHGTARNELQSSFDRANITPVDDGRAHTIRQGSQEIIAGLRQYSGPDFDLSYMRMQVNMHRFVINMLDQQLEQIASLRPVLSPQRESALSRYKLARRIVRGLPRD